MCTGGGRSLSLSPRQVERLYADFVAAFGARLGCDGEGGDAGCDANNAFFHWQDAGAYEEHLKASKPVAALERHFTLLADRFLRLNGVRGGLRGAARAHARAAGERMDVAAFSRIDAWGTVHRGCIGHDWHVHPQTTVSGVFYATMPEGAGGLVFKDMRYLKGAVQQQVHEVKPLPGHMLLFPSWLEHRVAPTPVSDNRVTLAFNIGESWGPIQETNTVL